MFSNVCYKQIDGVAMSSPVRRTFANLFLVYYENMWLDKCPHHFKPKYYRRYVDDIFLMFEKKDHVKKFLKYMNSRHQNIKFTFEEEQNNKITFLEISITRVGNELQTSLFQKKTFSGVYLILTATHHLNTKRVCCTPCYTKHITSAQIILTYTRKLFI